VHKIFRKAAIVATVLAAFAEPGGVILLSLLLLGAIYFWFSIPLLVMMTGLLLLLTFSCRQISVVYPWGGAYSVVRDNLGETAAQIAGAALLLNYGLTIAVGIAACIDQIASAFPLLFVYKVPIAAALLLGITYLNWRGNKVSDKILAALTYCFITLMLVLIGVGFWQVLNGNLNSDGGHWEQPSWLSTEFVFVFLLLRTLSLGTTAFPGLAALSADLAAFKLPRLKSAAALLNWDAALLLLMFIGVGGLGNWLQLLPTTGEALLSQVARAVYGDELLRLFTLGSTAIILLMAAQASLAAFPRLIAVQAGDGILPGDFTCQGKRPSFPWGLLLLAVLTGLLLFLFQGSVRRLIPLYMVGVFFAFTLAQISMAKHWQRIGILMETGALTPTRPIATPGSILQCDPLWRFKLWLNGISASLAALVMVICLITQFTNGAWLVILLMPLLLWMLKRIHQHYQEVTQRLRMAAERSL